MMKLLSAIDIGTDINYKIFDIRVDKMTIYKLLY